MIFNKFKEELNIVSFLQMKNDSYQFIFDFINFINSTNEDKDIFTMEIEFNVASGKVDYCNYSILNINFPNIYHFNKKLPSLHYSSCEDVTQKYIKFKKLQTFK